MRIILLTTDTPHHLYYAWKLSKRFSLAAIFLETKHYQAPFDIAHSFERERDRYEQDTLLQDFHDTWDIIAPTHCVSSMNDQESIGLLSSLHPDVVLVFGTGKLDISVIGTASCAFLNLHGGNPEEYRGLDSHLWAIYHNDFKNLVTTIHHMDANLDTGDIVLQTQLIFSRGAHLYELRSVNTKALLQLTLLALTSLKDTGSVPSRKQIKTGRYYSFMPSTLKELCVRKFERYTASL